MAKKKSNITKAKAKAKAMAKAGQNEITPAPINSLPSKILARIFQCLVGYYTQQCPVGKSVKHSRSLVYPDSLLHICSHWQQVALASPTLWSHIDIILSFPNSRKLLARAKAFLDRAGESPLDIHIVDEPARPERPYDKSDDEHSNLDLYLAGGFGLNCFVKDKTVARNDPKALEFVRSISKRASVKSVELVMTSDTMLHIYGPVFFQLLANRSPGTLKRLISRGRCSYHFISPQSFKLPGSLPPSTLRSLTDKLEAAWLPVTTVHINGGMCPSFDSTAFRGLTDLRLGGSDSTFAVSETQLMNIIKSSPKLRILKLSHTITQALPMNAQVTPIRLDDLEVLDVIENRWDEAEFQKFVRWITPGQRPLRVSLWCPLGTSSVMNFFRRSKVTELHIRLNESCDVLDAFELEEVIALSPGLRMLAVDACDNPFLSRCLPPRSQSTRSFSTRIDALHLQYCQSIDIDKLRLMIQKYSIHTLTTWSCTLLEGSHVAQDRDIFSLCSTVKRLKRREHIPMEEWIDSIV